jgi:ABC-type phosphate transport system auxiliary subunit
VEEVDYDLCHLNESVEEVDSAFCHMNDMVEEELSRVHDAFHRVIARQEQYRRQIAQKLDVIARLKAEISGRIREDNGFRVVPSRAAK